MDIRKYVEIKYLFQYYFKEGKRIAEKFLRKEKKGFKVG
jgi:hypothetical protein